MCVACVWVESSLCCRYAQFGISIQVNTRIATNCISYHHCLISPSQLKDKIIRDLGHVNVFTEFQVMYRSLWSWCTLLDTTFSRTASSDKFQVWGNTLIALVFFTVDDIKCSDGNWEAVFYSMQQIWVPTDLYKWRCDWKRANLVTRKFVFLNY